MAYEYQNFASLGVNLNRQAYGALDISAVFKTEADLTWYMTYGKESSKPAAWSKVEAPYPYEGQIVSLVPDTGVVTVYVLEAEKNERGEIQSYDDGKVKLVKKTLSIADSVVSSVNGLTGGVTIIPEINSIIRVEKDTNNIKIGSDTSGLVKINSDNIVGSSFRLSSGSVKVGVNGEGIRVLDSQSESDIIVGPTGIISNDDITITASDSNGSGEILIDGRGGVSISSTSGEVLINSTEEMIINCSENSFKFRKDAYSSPSEDNIYYVATEKYVNDKIGNISSNKITSPDGNSYVEVTDENGLKIKNKTFDLTVPQKSGTIALIGDLPKQASTTEFGTVKLTETVLADNTLVPTAGAVHTAIEQVKTEMAGGVIYKGGVANPAVSGTNVILTGAQTPIRPGYMYSITSGSITVDEVIYSAGDYIIYKGASEAPTTTVPASDLTFINAVGSDVVKLNVENTGNIDIRGDIQSASIHVHGSGEISELSTSCLDFNDSMWKIRKDNASGTLCITGSNEIPKILFPTTAGTIALTSDIKTYTAKANSGITLTNTEFSGVDATTTAKGVVQLASDMTTNDNLVPTVGVVKTEIEKLTQGLTGTKQLDETGGNYTVKDIVSLLNKVAALLGAPVYTA